MKAETKLSLSIQETRKLKRINKKINKQLLLLAIPYVLFLFPILLPIVFIKLRKKRRKLKSNIVNNTFINYYLKGKDAAIKYLIKHKNIIPPGTEQLFESMACQNDDQKWLEYFNAFLAKQQCSQIFLSNAGKNRFHKIRYHDQPKINHDIKISVIMPAYNSEATIELAMSSILNQTWKNLELIVVDDCSSDNTLHIAKKLAAQDSRIRILHNSVNAGPYIAKNRALNLSTGDYITGHDADDIALPDRLQKQITPILSEDNCDATLGYMIRLDKDGIYSSAAPVGRTSFNGICRLAFISLMLPKSILIEQIGFWDTVRFGADSEMIARVQDLLGDRLRKLETVTMLCLDHDAGLTNDTEHGIKTTTGLSQSRRDYQTHWRKWHSETAANKRFLPYPHVKRRLFPVPTAMQVTLQATTTEADELSNSPLS